MVPAGGLEEWAVLRCSLGASLGTDPPQLGVQLHPRADKVLSSSGEIFLALNSLAAQGIDGIQAFGHSGTREHPCL